MSALQEIWFILLAILLIGYTVLDGFDLGVGFWRLFTRKPEDHRALIGSIGPFWDGNEVWLVTAVGATFAAFPPVYAALFSGLYPLLLLLLLALIFRAVAIEFSASSTSPRTRQRWGVAFATGSTTAILMLGMIFGNLLRGLPLDRAGNVTGSFGDLLNPLAVLLAILNFALLATHGALYLMLRTEGEFGARAKTWAVRAWMLSVPVVIAALVAITATQPHLLRNYQATPTLWLLPASAVAAVALIGPWVSAGKTIHAFAASTVTIAALLASAAAALFPVMLPAAGHPELSLTAINASSSPLTLKTMLILTLIGLPVVLGYTFWAYRTFGGKVGNEEHY